MTDDLVELSPCQDRLCGLAPKGMAINCGAKANEPCKIVDVLTAEITRLRAELAAATERLHTIAEGDVPRQVKTPWAGLDTPSKHDICPHDNPMYNDCAECIVEFARLPIPGEDG